MRHDLYFTVETGLMPPTTCAFASSFTGVQFEVEPTPILPAKVEARAPIGLAYQNGVTLFYVQQFGARDAIAAAQSP